MLSYQPSLFKSTEILTAERFSQLIIDDYVVGRIKAVRHAQTHEERSRLKRTLPCIIWQATFMETTSAKGNVGRWRKQGAAVLNGLFMLDIDHVEEPEEMFKGWINKQRPSRPTPSPSLEGERPTPSPSLEGGGHIDPTAPEQAAELTAPLPAGRGKGEGLQGGGLQGLGVLSALGILLVHITPSGHGLRIVAKAQMDGNLIDNQRRLASQLGVECDESCKDASRLSYCPGFDDILYINSQELFSYENPEYDTRYGNQYRQGNSQPSSNLHSGNAHGAAPANGMAAPAARKSGSSSQQVGGQDGGRLDSGVKAYPDAYYGVKYETIIASWFKLHNGGVEPAQGDRHRVLLKVAGDLRYLCNNNKDALHAALLQHQMVRQYAADDPGDLAHICDSVCQSELWRGIPKRLAAVLNDTGVQLPGAAAGEGANAAVRIDYEAYWNRLQPLLDDCPILRDAVADLPDEHKLAGVLAAGAMLGTYLTRTWWEHFDGKFYRLSFLVYIIGSAASGKSFITLLDKLLLAPLQAADRLGREQERAYKDKEKKRKANEALPDRPHPVIRYCPSSTSNAILYRRLQDAIDNDVTDPDTGEPLHLHLITVESEIATALRAQVGSWAGKADLELKSFHNEVAGVDFANAESTNGPMQINWNEVMSGTTESMSRKIMPKNVLDGLVTRLVLFLMPDNDYAMLERRRALRNHERECMLRSVGYDLEKVSGELHVPRLVDFCYQYEEELTKRALVEQDRCLDYFRKRIPVIMIRYALVRIVLRQLEAAKKGEDLVVEDSDLEFARLIGDWCLEAQVHMFGQMVLDALEAEALAFRPRCISGNMMAKFQKLPKVINSKVLIENGVCKDNNAATAYLSRWQKGGLLKKIDRGNYEKC
jgi:hypothetical protein